MSLWRYPVHALVLACLAALAAPARAGPPYASDDPAPTDLRHYETYVFTSGASARDGTSTTSGVDFNYGAAPGLQLTVVLPVEYERPHGAGATTGLGNVELAAKYRFRHQGARGWDVAVFPRLFLPSASTQVGEKHGSLLLPLWLQRDGERWSTFGGGGCALNRGGDSRDYCMFGWALARQVRPDLQLGAELVHATPDARGGRAATRAGAGLRYDLDDHYHLLAAAGPGLGNAAASARVSWYVALLLTF